jgi:hypothetical protein
MYFFVEQHKIGMEQLCLILKIIEVPGPRGTDA